MAKVTQAVLTCDVCGNANDVQKSAFGFDGKQYEIDLCPKDSNGLSKVAAGYMAKARKITTRPGQRRGGHKPRSSREEPRSRRAEPASPSRPQKAKPALKQASKAGSKQPKTGGRQPKTGGRQPKTTGGRQPKATGGRQPKADGEQRKADGKRQRKGIYVYGILPADIDVAAGVPGVGEHPGPLGVIRSDGLAALVSEVDLPGRLGSPEDLQAHREILDSTVLEVPVLPLRFGTVLTGEGAVAEELLAPRHDEFAATLEQLDGQAQFVVKGRYVRTGLGEISGEAVAAKREEDVRALRQAMEGICVASAVKEPADELDAVHVAFLVAIDEEPQVERAIDDLAGEWEGRIEVELLGPMAAYDFVRADGD